MIPLFFRGTYFNPAQITHIDPVYEAPGISSFTVHLSSGKMVSFSNEKGETFEKFDQDHNILIESWAHTLNAQKFLDDGK